MLNTEETNYLETFKRENVIACEKCLGNGWVNGQMCACWEKYLLEVKKIQGQIPRKYINFTLDDIDVIESQTAKNQVEEYMKCLSAKRKTGDGLFLWSETKGTGKTALGCIILIEAIKQGYSVYFTDLNECVELTTDGWYDITRRHEFQKNILETDFLVIDDIGGMEIKSKGKGGDALIGSTFTTLFRRRCNALLPTIMTSNLAPDELGDDYNERLYSIACEHLKSIQCLGPDYRQQIAARKRKEK